MTIGGGRILKPASEGTEDGTHPEYSGAMRNAVRSISVLRDLSRRLLSIRQKLGAAA